MAQASRTTAGEPRPQPQLSRRFQTGALSSPPARPHAHRWHVTRGANGDQAYWQCQFCRNMIMRVGRRHLKDDMAWFDIVPCPEAQKALEDPSYLKPVLRRQTTTTGIDTPPYPWPVESATLEGLVLQPRPTRGGKSAGKGRTKADLEKEVEYLRAQLSSRAPGESGKGQPLSPDGQPAAATSTTPGIRPDPKARARSRPPSQSESQGSTGSWQQIPPESRTRPREAEEDPLTSERMTGQEMDPAARVHAENLLRQLNQMAAEHPDFHATMAAAATPLPPDSTLTAAATPPHQA